MICFSKQINAKKLYKKKKISIRFQTERIFITIRNFNPIINKLNSDVTFKKLIFKNLG